MDITYIEMSRTAIEIQDKIWKRKKIKNGSLFYIASKNLLFRFPCDAKIYYEKEDKVWWVDGILGEAIATRNRMVGEILLASGQGQNIRLFDCDEQAFYKYDDGELNFIWLLEQNQLQKIYFDYISKEMEDDEDPNAAKLTWAAFIIASINELKLFNLSWNRGHPAFESYEQLWLALIMISKYDKYWDDNKKKWMKRTNGF